jgi:hypothetical protein
MSQPIRGWISMEVGTFRDSQILPPLDFLEVDMIKPVAVRPPRHDRLVEPAAGRRLRLGPESVLARRDRLDRRARSCI